MKGKLTGTQHYRRTGAHPAAVWILGGQQTGRLTHGDLVGAFIPTAAGAIPCWRIQRSTGLHGGSGLAASSTRNNTDVRRTLTLGRIDVSCV